MNRGVEEMKEEMIALRQELVRLRNLVQPLTAISDLSLRKNINVNDPSVNLMSEE